MKKSFYFGVFAVCLLASLNSLHADKINISGLSNNRLSTSFEADVKDKLLKLIKTGQTVKADLFIGKDGIGLFKKIVTDHPILTSALTVCVAYTVYCHLDWLWNRIKASKDTKGAGEQTE